MVIKDISAKIDLCIKELLIVKELIDAKVADDFCARILATYAMLRVDDITKIWSHSIPKNDVLRSEYEVILKSYNNGLRKVRDKIGAHYQSPSNNVDLMGSVYLFRFIDYANTLCMLEQIFDFQEKRTNTKIIYPGFDDCADFATAKHVLESLYSDDQAYITNGALDLFGINKGGLISCTPAQSKGQYLRSIEMMTEIGYTLAIQPYNSKFVTNMFKRMFVCMVYNYHDNLITRSDIKPEADQYEEGFDTLFLSLITPNDNKEELEHAFEKFESIYKVGVYIKKNRKVRDHACAHLDELSDISKIDAELDSIAIDELYDVYIHMLNMFNYICNRVFTLKMISLPARSKIFAAQIETIPQNETYYGEVPKISPIQELNSKDILRSIRKQDARSDEAVEKLNRLLMSNNESEYREIISAINSRFQEPDISVVEISAIIAALYNARRGYPERLQRDILTMLQDDRIFKLHNGHLLWILSHVCRDDKIIDIKKSLESIIVQRSIISSALAILAYLHMIINKARCRFVANREAHDVDEDFKRYCKSISTPIEACALMMMLSQRWFFDPEYSYDRSYEIYYSQFFEAETTSTLNKYFVYIKFDDKEEMDLCQQYLRTKHYILLLNRLSIIENERNQQQNIFMDFWNNNCFYRTIDDMYEAFGVGLMTELSGKIDEARGIFESIMRNNPINECAIQTLEDFNKRHKITMV